MTAFSAHRLAQHNARVRGLYEHAHWLELDVTTPISDYLPHIVPVEGPQQLAELAAVREMNGPYQAADGSWYLHRIFPGGVTWQAIAYNTPAGISPAEQQARTWAALHGCVIVPLADLIAGA